MQYMVIGSDGKEYGPATVDTLKQWVTEGRLTPESPLKDFGSGESLSAGQVPDLFGPAPAMAAPPMVPNGTPTSYEQQYRGGSQDWSQAPSPYYRPNAVQSGRHPGTGMLWNSIIRSILALVFFFVLGGIGLIIGAYAVYYGYRAMASDHKLGKFAFGFSILCFLAIVVGWVLRLQSGHSPFSP